MNAVPATIVVEVPTARFIGTPQERTINGTRNEPPETPTIPAPKPVATITGIAIFKFMIYSFSPDFKFKKPFFVILSVFFSETGLNIKKAAINKKNEKINFNVCPVKY